MLRTALEHLRAQWMGALALFLVIGARVKTACRARRPVARARLSLPLALWRRTTYPVALGAPFQRAMILAPWRKPRTLRGLPGGLGGETVKVSRRSSCSGMPRRKRTARMWWVRPASVIGRKRV